MRKLKFANAVLPLFTSSIDAPLILENSSSANRGTIPVLSASPIILKQDTP